MAAYVTKSFTSKHVRGVWIVNGTLGEMNVTVPASAGNTAESIQRWICANHDVPMCMVQSIEETDGDVYELEQQKFMDFATQVSSPVLGNINRTISNGVIVEGFKLSDITFDDETDTYSAPRDAMNCDSRTWSKQCADSGFVPIGEPYQLDAITYTMTDELFLSLAHVRERKAKANS